MLCVSPIFAVARCPSVTLVDCTRMAKDIITLLTLPGSPIIPVFLTKSAGTQFQGEPLQQGCKVQGVRKFCDFRPTLSSISETVRDRPMVTVEC